MEGIISETKKETLDIINEKKLSHSTYVTIYIWKKQEEEHDVMVTFGARNAGLQHTFYMTLSHHHLLVATTYVNVAKMVRCEPSVSIIHANAIGWTISTGALFIGKSKSALQVKIGSLVFCTVKNIRMV